LIQLIQRLRCLNKYGIYTNLCANNWRNNNCNKCHYN
jgi:hypothetical protein